MSYQFIYELPEVSGENNHDGSSGLRQLTYQTEIEAHMSKVNEMVLSYISLLDQERAQRALIASSERVQQSPGSHQDELARIRQQLRDLAVQFFNWKFDVQELKMIDLLTQHELDLMIIHKLEVYGLPEDPVSYIDVNSEEKKQWNDAFRRVITCIRKELQKHKEAQDLLSTKVSGEMSYTSVPGRSREADAVSDTPAITSKLMAYMQVEKRIKSVLVDLQKIVYPNCICDGSRIYSVLLGMTVVDVQIEFNSKGQPLRYLCSLFVNYETGIVLSYSADYSEQSLISTIRDMHLKHGAKLWIGELNLPDHW